MTTPMTTLSDVLEKLRIRKQDHEFIMTDAALMLMEHIPIMKMPVMMNLSGKLM